MPALRLLFGFRGRVRRTQWWVGHGAAMLGLALIITVVAVTAANLSEPGSPNAAAFIGNVLYGLYALLLWISIALGVKRYHDLDRSGWWILLGLVPLANVWMLLELGFFEGMDGPNRFGPSTISLGPDELHKVFS
jgi:uncharacterized membrane protein YhaH (DUF805 family)